MIEIYIGSLKNPDYYFADDQIFEAPSSQAVALVGQELSIDTFTPIVMDSIENTKDILVLRSSDGDTIELQDGSILALSIADAEDAELLISIPEGTPIWYYRDQTMIGKFYVDKIVRQAKNKYQINTVSAIGRLDKMYHDGGVFRRSTFENVVRHILAVDPKSNIEPVIPYEIDDDVKNIPVSGWLPYDTKRNNLYRLIFANGVNIVKSTSGDPRFTFVYTSGEDVDTISDRAIFSGGTVEYERPYSSVSIMEHTYSAITEDVSLVTLFDNTESGSRVSNELVTFSQAPIIVGTIQATGDLQIVSRNENSAILTGSGKLTGIPYTHSTRTITRKNEEGDQEKTVSVQNCTMVNELNSENLLNRLYAFYCPQNYIKKIKNEIVYNGERCGKQYLFTNPYGEKEIAMLAKMETRASSFNRSACEFYAGYNPAGQAGLFKHCIILDKATLARDGGVFTVPAEVFEQENPQFKVVIIGGGTGGSSGCPGENGKDASTYTDVATGKDISGMWYGAEGGNGGQGGSGGTPGRVFAITIQNPQQTYNYTIGTGGEGGDATGFIPDTASELRRALENEHPDTEYTDAQINNMVAQEKTLTDWDGASHKGSAGTASTFGPYSSADPDAYIPSGGVYESINGKFYAQRGAKGRNGGKGGARQVTNGGVTTWTTDGESLVQEIPVEDDMWLLNEYKGGTTGTTLTSIPDLPECKFTAYGGNGAGAAIGISSTMYKHMNGGSDQETFWEVVEDGV